MKVTYEGYTMTDGRWTRPDGSRLDSTDVPLEIQREVWRQVRAQVPPVPAVDRKREARETRYRASLPEAAGAAVLAAYDHQLSLENGRREFTIEGIEDCSTTDMAWTLLECDLVSGYEDEEALAPKINDFLVGSGFRLREYPRDLGLGNSSPNRPDPRAQAQRRQW